MTATVTEVVSTNIRDFLARNRTLARKVVKRIRFRGSEPRMVSAQTLSDRAFLALFDLREISALAKQGDIPAAKAALLAHYGRRAASSWPAFPSRLTDLKINTDELSQKELIALADAIVEHRFVLVSSDVSQIILGGEIDWHAKPTPDREWGWKLNRHQWWPILALAYSQTGNERYTIEFVNQMLDWVKGNLPPAKKNEKSLTWRLMEVGMRMRVSWIPTFVLFYDSPVFTDRAKLAMLRSIYDHARFLSLFSTRLNHLLRESNGLAYASVYFPEFKEAKRWQQIALTRLDQELTKQVNQDGTHVEMSTGYQWLVVDEYQATFDLLRANHLSLPNQDLTHWLRKMYRVLAYLVRPDGTYPRINDGSVHWKHTLLAQAGETLGCDDVLYIGTDGNRGTCPEDTLISFRDAGLYVMRSNWTKEAHYLLFGAGPYGGFHGHEDKLSIEVAAFGQPFVVDSGSYTYDAANPLRAYFVGSQGHNTVLVDGKSQIRRWRQARPEPVSGGHATWISQPDFDFLAATYDDGYSTFSLRKPEGAKVIEDVTHTRRILFVKPDYWLIVDELQASLPHNYQALFHTDPRVVVRPGPDNRVILSTQPDAATLHLIPADPQSVQASWLTGGEPPIQSWYSTGLNHKAPSTVVIYEWKSSASAAMVTLLYPCPAGQTGDAVSIEPLPVSGDQGLAFMVTTNSGRDYVKFSQDGSLKQFGPYQSSGIVAGVRTDISGDILTRFEWQAGRNN